MGDRRLLRRAPEGEVDVHADLSGLVDWPINDMVVDAEGRAYVGNFGFDLMNGAFPATTTLVRVDPDGTAVARRGSDLPQRLGDHPGRRHADRGRDRRRALHGIHDRRRRLAHRPPRLGAGR